MTGKQLPVKLEELPPPWYVRLYWWCYAQARWPADVRQLKREGWTREGWQKWRSP